MQIVLYYFNVLKMFQCFQPQHHCIAYLFESDHYNCDYRLAIVLWLNVAGCGWIGCWCAWIFYMVRILWIETIAGIALTQHGHINRFTNTRSIQMQFVDLASVHLTRINRRSRCVYLTILCTFNIFNIIFSHSLSLSVFLAISLEMKMFSSSYFFVVEQYLHSALYPDLREDYLFSCKHHNLRQVLA